MTRNNCVQAVDSYTVVNRNESLLRFWLLIVSAEYCLWEKERKMGNLVVMSFGLATLLVAGCASIPAISGSAFLTSEQEKVIHNFSFWDSNCLATYFNIRILKQPQNGQLEIRNSTSTIPEKAVIGSVSPQCSGQKIQSKQVVYIADTGYQGTDEITISVRAPDSPNAQPYQTTLTVR